MGPRRVAPRKVPACCSTEDGGHAPHSVPRLAKRDGLCDRPSDNLTLNCTRKGRRELPLRRWEDHPHQPHSSMEHRRCTLHSHTASRIHASLLPLNDAVGRGFAPPEAHPANKFILGNGGRQPIPPAPLLKRSGVVAEGAIFVLSLHAWAAERDGICARRKGQWMTP